MTEFTADFEGSALILVVDEQPLGAGVSHTAVLNQAGLQTPDPRGPPADGLRDVQRGHPRPRHAHHGRSRHPSRPPVATATRTLPIVLVTDPVGEPATLAGLEAGADDELTKPVDPTELVTRLRAHLRAQAAWSQVVDGHRRER